LVALFERDGEARVILTKRPETMPSHQGEIAFPGGKHDPDVDVTLVATALREAQEEVALEPDRVEVVGELDTLSTVASQFVITPYVGILETPQLLVPHAREVVSVFDVALSELFDPQTHRSEIWQFPHGPELNIHFYELPGETVWGATARILTNLLTTLSATR
jgi:8-oxo-dGTP pyrophosphatase MutT (NUDIX family)